MKTKTHIKAGSLTTNHNQTQMRAGSNVSCKIRTSIKAGLTGANHNETQVCAAAVPSAACPGWRIGNPRHTRLAIGAAGSRSRPASRRVRGHRQGPYEALIASSRTSEKSNLIHNLIIKPAHLFFVRRWHFAFAIALACLLAPLTSEAKQTPFSRIIIFGDSLCDTGNFFHLTGDLFPPPPYADGRFSNGPLWIEYVAEDLGMQILPGDNYAVGGATTGHFNIRNGQFGLQYPGLQDEIASFLATIQPGGADPDALYVVWTGANDFFLALATGNPDFLFTDSLPNTILALQLLWQAGARHILVPNVPDLGLTPDGIASGRSAQITFLCTLYNQALAGALDSLAEQGIPTIQVDAFATLQAMVNFPADFGFTNVTVPLLDVLLGGGHANPDEFLFWDPVRPTTRGHEVLGHEALHAMIDYFSPSHGQGAPDGQANALNGLVHAGKP